MFHSGQLTGNWTLLTGLVGWGSQPGAKWRLSNWRTKCRVRSAGTSVLQRLLASFHRWDDGVGRVCSCHSSSCPAGELFAQAPVREFPGIAVETVSDSSRYFVLRIQDDSGEGLNVSVLRVHRSFVLESATCVRACLSAGRSAFIGVGFGDRGDAFDFNVALQDHFK